MPQVAPWQAEIVQKKIAPMLQYVGRLLDQMKKQGFKKGDPLYSQVSDALDAMHYLATELHYLSIGTGDGRKPTVTAPKTKDAPEGD